MNYTKPKVTIDLDEYLELLKKSKELIPRLILMPGEKILINNQTYCVGNFSMESEGVGGTIQFLKSNKNEI